PIYWERGISDEEKYFLSVSEYASEFDKNMENGTIQTKMFTIHNTAKCIPLKKYLAEVILDDPAVTINGAVLFDIAKKALATSLHEMGFDANILKIRTCNNCFCKINYSNQVSAAELQKLFIP
ncbi:MAG: hypothetical protein K2H12_08475, partial [Acetatifactor sp.]|nr:hypothetical protein [Acetatifactor sp.]